MKEKIKFFLIIVAILSMLIVPFIILDIVISKDENASNLISEEEEGIQPPSPSSDVEENEYKPYYAKENDVEIRNKVLDIIYKYIFAINDEEYSKAYNMLSAEYREFKFKDINEYISYCKNKFKIDIGINVNKISSIEDGVLVYVNVFPEQIGDKEIREEDMFNYNDYMYIHKDGNDYIAFDGFLGTKVIKSNWLNSKININFLKEHKFVDYTIFDVEVENLSEDTFNVWKVIDNVTVEDEGSNTFWVNNRDTSIEYDIIPGEKIVLKWKFNSKIDEAKCVNIKFNTDFLDSSIKVKLERK